MAISRPDSNKKNDSDGVTQPEEQQDDLVSGDAVTQPVGKGRGKAVEKPVSDTAQVGERHSSV